MEEKTDKELYKEFLQGNKESFEKIVIKHKDAIIYFIQRNEDTFRIATTTGNIWVDKTTANSLYVLNDKLEEIGKITDFAKEEKIYSERYVGDKAYVVTFKQTDPLFVIDLSDSKNPQILGELKIPGYSTYLHPYDETHLI